MSATCPHDCKKCRAIELGLGGRPLTMEEFVEVQGGLVELSPSPNGWSSETNEAAIALDEAHAVAEEASRTYAAALRALREEARGSDRAREVATACALALKDRDEAWDRRVKLQTEYMRLNRSDVARRQAVERAEAAVERARELGEEKRRAPGRKALAKIVGRGH